MPAHSCVSDHNRRYMPRRVPFAATRRWRRHGFAIFGRTKPLRRGSCVVYDDYSEEVSLAGDGVAGRHDSEHLRWPMSLS
jgi:hypothetical protein